MPCGSCHNGSYTRPGHVRRATAWATPPHIPTGTLECSNCHTNTASWTAYTMNHAAVSALRAAPATTAPSSARARRGAGKATARRHHGGMLHLPHRARRVGPAPRSATPASAIPIARPVIMAATATGHDDASAHSDRQPPVQQLPRQHGSELHHLHDEPHGGGRHPCASCHNGSYAGQGTSGAQGLSTPPHIPTGTLECSNCHTDTATGPTTR